MAVVELIYDVKPYSYITSNPTKILSNGEPIYLNDGRFGFGDGVTTLSALPLFGSATTWGSITGTLSSQTDLQTALNAKQNTIITGTTSQYLRGDLSLATFPTNVSSFTNDSGYITSSALSPYLTIANAASTYQPIGSYLTGLTVGSTAIGSGTNTRILYNNGGVLGEYAVTGTGTTAVLSTSPTISTSLTVTTTSTTNVIRDLVGTPTSSAIYLNQTTPSATNYTIASDGSNTYINSATATYLRLNNTDRLTLGSSYNEIYGTTRINYSNSVYQNISCNSGGHLYITAPGTTNALIITSYLHVQNTSNDRKIFFSRTGGNDFSFEHDTSSFYLYNNTTGKITLRSFNNGDLTIGHTSSNIHNIYGTTRINYDASNYVSKTVSSLGNITYNNVTSTQTAGANLSNYKWNGITKTWAAGTLATQYFNYFSANTVAFASASTATNVYGLYVEAATAGTNATITNNYAAGFGGNVNILSGELRNSGTKVVGTRDTGWTAFTNTTNKGTSYDTATVTLQQLAERVAALQAALTTHGLLGV